MTHAQKKLNLGKLDWDAPVIRLGMFARCRAWIRKHLKKHARRRQEVMA